MLSAEERRGFRKVETFAMGKMIKWTIFLFILTTALGGAGLLTYRYRLNLETAAIHQSNGFVEARVAELNAAAADYNRLAVQAATSPELSGAIAGQQQAIVERMRAAASGIPAKYVPDAAAVIIGGGR